MPKTIRQTIRFRNASPQQLYELYMDQKKHALVTGAQAKITSKEGTTYSAHDGYITGKNLQLVPGRLIVQSWRASDWSEDTIDSTFILLFEANGKDSIVQMIQANVPDNQVVSLSKGWRAHYWDHWKQWLSDQPIGAPPTK